jgi:hypothetical protein
VSLWDQQIGWLKIRVKKEKQKREMLGITVFLTTGVVLETVIHPAKLPLSFPRKRYSLES